MRRIWLFRSNIRELEYYHSFKTIEEFKKKCHDFYLLQLIWFLENDHFDEATIWRLKPKEKFPSEIGFKIGDKTFIQRFVNHFGDCLSYESPDVSFWRGGFVEYDRITSYPTNLGLKLYCGTGRRIVPQYGGVYHKILIEDQKDLEKYKNHYDCIPFYKTANPEIFKPILAGIHYDICWPANFTQIRYKGQEFFIREISKSKYLKSLRIVNVGNKPDVGKKLCKKYGVTNIEFLGWIDRPKLNDILCSSRVAICLSNRNDGCPRVVTEILASATPLLVRDTTRLLDFYKNIYSPEFNKNNFEEQVKFIIKHHAELYSRLWRDLDRFSIDTICKKNISLWKS